MGDYFKPPRRKIGVLILMMACLVAALWVRGIVTGDSDIFDSTDWTGTTNGVSFASGPTFDLVFGPSGSMGRRNNNDHSLRVAIGGDDKWVRIANIPHWSIVIPLTLLSAWLLLSKQKLAKPKAKFPS